MFKRGDKIRCIKAYYNREVGDILTLTTKEHSNWLYEENTSGKGDWIALGQIDNWELVVENFQVGDTISLDEDITLHDILENGWGSIKFNNLKGDLVVTMIVRKKTLTFEGGYGSYSCRLFKLVDRPIKVKEMTIAELEAQLGYSIKVVK